MKPGDDPPDRDSSPEPQDAITRRRFVASGAAIGATIVWASGFPFSDAAIGQKIVAGDPTGATGTTGPTGHGGHTEHGRTFFNCRAEGDADGNIELWVSNSPDGTLTVHGVVVSGGSASDASAHRVRYAHLEHHLAKHRHGHGAHFVLKPTAQGKAFYRRSRRHNQKFHVRLKATFHPDGGRAITKHRMVVINPAQA